MVSNKVTATISSLVMAAINMAMVSNKVTVTISSLVTVDINMAMVSNKVMDLRQVMGSKVMAMASSLVTAWTITPTTADIITPVPMVQTAPTTNTRRATERTKSQSRTKRTVIMVSQVMGNKVTTTISSLLTAVINKAMVSNKVTAMIS